MTKVAIFMGSISDKEMVLPCTEILKKLGISFTIKVTSAHRTPERTALLVKELEDDGCEVFICAAGMAAHLAGAVAAKTIKPVIGIPITASSLGGMDALLSTVMMPPGFPVGTVSLDKAGAKNAAWYAAQIIALGDTKIAQQLLAERASLAKDVEITSVSLENSL